MTTADARGADAAGALRWARRRRPVTELVTLLLALGRQERDLRDARRRLVGPPT